MSIARQEQIRNLTEARLDVLVVGGGINGAGVLRDLALRAQHAGQELRVGLVEQGHFASGTSGKNSQLIHGGLRYLKYLQIHLVREALHERSVLLRIAPQFVQPLKFLLPMYGSTSRLLYGTGLWLYDRLAGSDAIAQHRMISRGEVAGMEPGLRQDGLNAAAIFWDAAVQSARFVVENILDAIAHGACAANYVKATAWQREGPETWRVACEDALTGERFEIHARKLVDARGAWMDGQALRLVRGSHIVIPRVSSGGQAIAHFEPDGRIVFLIPWGSENQLTLVGTTDEDHHASPERVHISAAELEYLAAVVRKLFPERRDLAPVSTFSSLRSLVRAGGSSPTSASRGHKIWNSRDGILHVAGGKYTTYRRMSEEAGDQVCREVAPALAQVHQTEHRPFARVDREIGGAMEQRLSDYLFVSTYLGYERRWDAEALAPLAEALGHKLGWDESRVRQEVDDIIEAAVPVGA
ncbi:MAG: glycerol-3-phosphate dehydrogenase/oxidase [Acidobacteriia bacterium]|nr:glycerol-3-phosphate dehydrogenase/oxidase [Terriglobia bacterium]